ncbi:MAG: Rdx family protein [Candidatus Marinimicrobia bacterium]|nr:Rdx family protein [Candidatus Neomarinimicrobiota bacterium]
MVADILERFGNDVESLTILPSGGGVYEIWRDDELIFSKKQLSRFPHSSDEVMNLF